MFKFQILKPTNNTKLIKKLSLKIKLSLKHVCIILIQPSLVVIVIKYFTFLYHSFWEQNNSGFTLVIKLHGRHVLFFFWFWILIVYPWNKHGQIPSRFGDHHQRRAWWWSVKQSHVVVFPKHTTSVAINLPRILTD